MKSEIIMCNYYGMCDAEGEAVGHTVKVTNEYGELLNEIAVIGLMASPCIVKEANKDVFNNIVSLKYNISIIGNGRIKRIIDKYKILYNIYYSIRENRNYFFYQVDFFFFLYIFLFYRRRKERRIFCLIYHQDFTSKIFNRLLNKIYIRALNKIDGVIYTQSGKKVIHDNIMWMPDYIYTTQQYMKYQKLEKEDKVVCVGTMNHYKQLEELVSTFKRLNISLYIAGRFDDEERFEKLLREKSDNIEIHNINMSYEEYLRVLASAKYSILPYNMNQYKNRTSGVLLESIYVGSIPVAPEELLKQNILPGIGYRDINELNENSFYFNNKDYIFEKIYINNDKSKILSHFKTFFAIE